MNVVIIERRRDPDNTVTEDFRVRRDYVERWLRFLKAHSEVPGYRNMVISDCNISALPVDGVPDDLPRIIDPNLDFEIFQRDENDADLVDRDGNPSSDTGIYFPPNDLAVGFSAMENIFQDLRDQLSSQEQMVLNLLNTCFLSIFVHHQLKLFLK